MASTLNLSATSDLQQAIGDARPGDEIVLPAGSRFTAPSTDYPYTLHAKNDQPVTIRSSRASERPANSEFNIADRAKLATLVGMGPAGALSARPGSGGYKFIGIEFTNESDGSERRHANQLIDLTNSEYDPRNPASGFEFDWCYVCPQDGEKQDQFTRTATRGVFSNADNVWFRDSRIVGFLGYYAHARNTLIDSEAFLSTAGSSNSGIVNSTIEAYFNPLFLGGADSPTFNTSEVLEATTTAARLKNVNGLKVEMAITFKQPTGENANGYVKTIDGDRITFTPLVRYGSPAVAPEAGSVCGWDGLIIRNFTLERCRVKIPSAFARARHEDGLSANQDLNPKGFMEIKNVDGLLVKGNHFSGYPTTLALTARNQGGAAPWSTIRNVYIVSNLFEQASTVVILALSDAYRLSTEGGNVKVRNNVALDAGDFLQTEGGDGWEADHNTIINKRGSSLIRGVTLGFKNGKLTNNIFQWNTYGLNCTIPPNTRDTCWPNLIEGGNVVVDNRSDKYGGGLWSVFPKSMIAESLALVGLDATGKLTASSQFKGKGLDGKDPGVDMEVLLAAMGGQTSTPPPVPVSEVSLNVKTSLGINPISCVLKVERSTTSIISTENLSSPGQLAIKARAGSGVSIKPFREGYKFTPAEWKTSGAVPGDVMFFASAEVIPPPPPQPVVRKVSWPTGETRQNEILATQWRDRYRLKRHLTGAYAEFEKV